MIETAPSPRSVFDLQGLHLRTWFESPGRLVAGLLTLAVLPIAAAASNTPMPSDRFVWSLIWITIMFWTGLATSSPSAALFFVAALVGSVAAATPAVPDALQTGITTAMLVTYLGAVRVLTDATSGYLRKAEVEPTHNGNITGRRGESSRHITDEQLMAATAITTRECRIDEYQQHDRLKVMLLMNKHAIIAERLTSSLCTTLSATAKILGTRTDQDEQIKTLHSFNSQWSAAGAEYERKLGLAAAEIEVLNRQITGERSQAVQSTAAASDTRTKQDEKIKALETSNSLSVAAGDENNRKLAVAAGEIEVLHRQITQERSQALQSTAAVSASNAALEASLKNSLSATSALQSQITNDLTAASTLAKVLATATEAAALERAATAAHIRQLQTDLQYERSRVPTYSPPASSGPAASPIDITYAKRFDGNSFELPNWRNGITRFIDGGAYTFPTALSAVIWVLGLLDGEAADASATWDPSDFVWETDTAADAVERVLTRLGLLYIDVREPSRPRAVRDWQRHRQRNVPFVAFMHNFEAMAENALVAQAVLAVRPELRDAARAAVLARTAGKRVALEDMEWAVVRELFERLDESVPAAGSAAAQGTQYVASMS